MEQTFYIVNGYKTDEYVKATQYAASTGGGSIKTGTARSLREEGIDVHNLPALPELTQ